MIFCVKLDRKKIALLVVLAGAVLCGLVLLLSGGRAAQAFGGEVSGKNVRTGEDRINFLKKLGWEADAGTEEVREVLIPTEFNDAYLEYNELQLTQGCDLTRYSGKRVRRYTYELKNYPGEEGVTASLLIYKDIVIGGDICSPRLDGFMHGLTME